MPDHTVSTTKLLQYRYNAFPHSLRRNSSRLLNIAHNILAGRFACRQRSAYTTVIRVKMEKDNKDRRQPTSTTRQRTMLMTTITCFKFTKNHYHYCFSWYFLLLLFYHHHHHHCYDSTRFFHFSKLGLSLYFCRCCVSKTAWFSTELCALTGLCTFSAE